MSSMNLVRRLSHRIGCLRSYSSAHSAKPLLHTKDEGEPDDYMFNLKPGQRHKWTAKDRIFLYGYGGGLVVYAILLAYKPGPNEEDEARDEALRRMRERGIQV